MFEPTKKARTSGFRFFPSDAVVIVSVALAAIPLRRIENPLWWILAIVLGHFFLFCNVFRIRRWFEMAWALIFFINIASWLLVGELIWKNVLICQLPLTAGLLFAELQSRRYHGIFARWINPRLKDYLEGRIP
jgi:hypothetical protein